jgi:hypothetical protein
VAGQPAVGSGSLSVAVDGTRYNGLEALSESKTLTIDFAVTDTSLTLSTTDSELNFELPVTCSVHDGSITGNLAVDVVAHAAVTVGLVGETLELESDYNDRYGACLRAPQGPELTRRSISSLGRA